MRPCTAFLRQRLLHAGILADVALAVKAATKRDASSAILVFDDATGRVIDLDLRGTDADIVKRLSKPPQTFVGRYRSPSAGDPDHIAQSDSKGRGRPKLGVVSREVTLLPKQWEWLAEQPGGASSVLRRLVEDARTNANSLYQQRAARDAAYQVMHAIAGDLPGYEEGTRALFAGDRDRFERSIRGWPADVRNYVLRLAFRSEDAPRGKP